MDKYRKGVGIFLINTKGKLWVGKRIDFKNDFWQMPQGGIDNNESPKEAMKRELMEEVGIFKKYRVLRESEKWLKYDLPKDILDSVWNGKYVGQSQKWFACRFEGDDKEINLNLHYPEFEDWKWINPLESINLVVPFKKKLYTEILKNFKDLYS